MTATRSAAALFEVSQPRVTCYRVGLRLGEPRLPALLVAHRRPGFYLRVLREGVVEAGDPIVQGGRRPGADDRRRRRRAALPARSRPRRGCPGAAHRGAQPRLAGVVRGAAATAETGCHRQRRAHRRRCRHRRVVRVPVGAGGRRRSARPTSVVSLRLAAGRRPGRCRRRCPASSSRCGCTAGRRAASDLRSYSLSGAAGLARVPGQREA